MFALIMKYFLLALCANMAGVIVLLWACSCARNVWITMLAYLAGSVLLSCGVAFMIPMLLSNGSAFLNALAQIRGWLCLIAISGALVWCRQFLRSNGAKRRSGTPALSMKHQFLLILPTMLAALAMIGSWAS